MKHMKKFLRRFLKFLLFTGLALAVLVGLYMWDEWVWLQNAPKVFSKPNAELRAREALAKYAAEQHVPIREFKGPYFEEILGLDFSAYIVCYSHPKHHFCYNHWLGDMVARPLRTGEPPKIYRPPDYQGRD